MTHPLARVSLDQNLNVKNQTTIHVQAVVDNLRPSYFVNTNPKKAFRKRKLSIAAQIYF